MKYHNKQPKEPMQTRDIPLLPWQVVVSDILEHKNQHYLVVIDYYSKYIETLRLKVEFFLDMDTHKLWLQITCSTTLKK